MNFHSALTRSLGFSLLIFASYLMADAQPDSIYKLPAGTRIKLKLDVELSSKVAGLNDTFLASVAQPVVIRDTVVVPKGTVIEGRVIGAKAASAPGRPGKLDLVFETLRISSEVSRSIDAVLAKDLRAKQSPIGVLSIVGGTAAGAVFGGVARSGKGAVMGAGIGAGVGTVVALDHKGSDVRILRNIEFDIVLRKEVVLPVSDY